MASRECSISTWRRVTRSLMLAVAIVIVNPARGFAQLNGQNIKGDAGLKSGSQAPPGTYVAVPLYLRTTTEGAAWNFSSVFPLKPIQIP